jgi:arsenite-transporting ATPase
VAQLRGEKEVEEDQILGELQYIRDRINKASTILADRKRTAFFFVLIPEEMVLIDTRKAAQMFARFNVPIAGYVLNRVLPEELAGENAPAFLTNRIKMQERYLGQIRSTLGEQILAQVPEFERDVTGLEMIERTAKVLFREG